LLPVREGTCCCPALFATCIHLSVVASSLPIAHLIFSMSILRAIRRQFPTAVILIYFVISILVMDWVNTYAYERVPEALPPLPDLGFDYLPKPDWSIYPVDIITIGLCLSGILIGFKNRRLGMQPVRRLFAVYCMLMNMRACTIIVTTLPICYSHGPCREGHIPLRSRIMTTLSYAFALGFKVPGVVQCGDYIFSGHTTFIWLLVLHLSFSGRLNYLGLLFVNLVGLFGSLCIIAWRNHYTIDVLLAFFITQVTWRYYFAKLDLLLLTRSPSSAFDHVICWLEQLKPTKDSSQIQYSTISEKLVLDSSSSSDDELVLEMQPYSPKLKSKDPVLAPPPADSKYNAQS
jgi:hypothetical protein